MDLQDIRQDFRRNQKCVPHTTGRSVHIYISFFITNEAADVYGRRATFVSDESPPPLDILVGYVG